MIEALSLIPLLLIIITIHLTKGSKHWQDDDNREQDCLLHTTRYLSNEEREKRWQVKWLTNNLDQTAHWE